MMRTPIALLLVLGFASAGHAAQDAVAQARLAEEAAFEAIKNKEWCEAAHHFLIAQSLQPHDELLRNASKAAAKSKDFALAARLQNARAEPNKKVAARYRRAAKKRRRTKSRCDVDGLDDPAQWHSPEPPRTVEPREQSAPPAVADVTAKGAPSLAVTDNEATPLPNPPERPVGRAASSGPLSSPKAALLVMGATSSAFSLICVGAVAAGALGVEYAVLRNKNAPGDLRGFVLGPGRIIVLTGAGLSALAMVSGVGVGVAGALIE